MPGFLLHVGATVMCPHGGQVTAIPSSPKVLVGGQPVVTMADNFPIAGCAFTIPPGKPQPCVKVQWTVPATKVTIGGQFGLIATSSGLCQSAEQAPQGAPIVSVTQVKASAT
jgi:hypothetical protein